MKKAYKFNVCFTMRTEGESSLEAMSTTVGWLKDKLIGAKGFIDDVEISQAGFITVIE